jgi:hypothetical protein
VTKFFFFVAFWLKNNQKNGFGCPSNPDLFNCCSKILSMLDQDPSENYTLKEWGF